MTAPGPRDSVELLPCPFCGGEPERIDFGPGSGDNEGGSCIACAKCQASGPVEFGRKENFVSHWNTRRALPQQAGGEDYSALKTRLHDSAMLSTLPEWCRKELEQGADAIAALQAEVARLRRERAELIDKLNGTPCAEVRWQQERERLQAALLEAGRDAERWRFLTSMDVGEYIGLVEYNNPDKLAAAIDAARLVRDGDSGEGYNNGEPNV